MVTVLTGDRLNKNKSRNWYCKVSLPFLVTKQSNQICPFFIEQGKKVKSIKNFVFWLIPIWRHKYWIYTNSCCACPLQQKQWQRSFGLHISENYLGKNKKMNSWWQYMMNQEIAKNWKIHPVGIWAFVTNFIQIHPMVAETFQCNTTVSTCWWC